MHPPCTHVRQRLRDKGVIELAVPPPPVADKVDDAVHPHLLPPFHREAAHTGHRLDVVGVDVKDGCPPPLADVGAVVSGGTTRGKREGAGESE